MTEFNTRLVHGPAQNDNQTGAVNVPIYTSTTYRYPKIGAAVQYDYGRSGNPTRQYLEDQLAALEHGTRGLALSSGMAAIHTALAIFKAGDHIIVGDQIYGGTFRLLNQFFKRWGLSATQVDTRDPAAIERAIQPNTKAVYFEPVTNPLLQVTSIAAVAKVAKKHDLLTIVDNTFLSPYLCQPLTLGADIVIHSATKYLAGHSDVSAGAVITNDEKLGDRLYFVQNALGAVLSPEDSNLVRRGLQTLSVRMDRQQANVKAIIAHLQPLPAVKKIYYPGLLGQPGYETLSSQAKGAGGVLSIELADNVDAVKFVDSLQLFQLAVSLGSVESLVELPSKMSHAELSPAEQLKAGITPGLIRLAVGIEDQCDLIADLDQALAKAV